MVDTILFQKDLTRDLNFDLKEKNIFVIHTTGFMHLVVLTNINHGFEDK